MSQFTRRLTLEESLLPKLKLAALACAYFALAFAIASALSLADSAACSSSKIFNSSLSYLARITLTSGSSTGCGVSVSGASVGACEDVGVSVTAERLFEDDGRLVAVEAFLPPPFSTRRGATPLGDFCAVRQTPSALRPPPLRLLRTFLVQWYRLRSSAAAGSSSLKCLEAPPRPPLQPPLRSLPTLSLLAVMLGGTTSLTPEANLWPLPPPSPRPPRSETGDAAMPVLVPFLDAADVGRAGGRGTAWELSSSVTSFFSPQEDWGKDALTGGDEGTCVVATASAGILTGWPPLDAIGGGVESRGVVVAAPAAATAAAISSYPIGLLDPADERLCCVLSCRVEGMERIGV